MGTGKRIHGIDMRETTTMVAWQPRQGSNLLAIARDAKNDEKNHDPRYNRSDFVRLLTVPSDELLNTPPPGMGGGSSSSSSSSRRMAD